MTNNESSEPSNFSRENSKLREALKRESDALYSDADGSPTLRESFVAYLDELGTSASLREFDNEKLIASLENQSALRAFLHDDSRELRYQRFLSFSDNVITGSPIDSTLDDDGLLPTILSVGMFQLNLVSRGRFLRGGIDRGLLYMGEGYVTGPALLSAVKAEEKCAIYPRVLVTAKAMEAVPMLTRFYGQISRTPHNDYIIIDEDNCFFINYLAFIESDSPVREDAVGEGLEMHAQAVTKGLNAFRNNERVRSKYEWAAQYHNWARLEFFSDWVVPKSADPSNYLVLDASNNNAPFAARECRYIADADTSGFRVALDDCRHSMDERTSTKADW